jgi:hypothetical protein
MSGKQSRERFQRFWGLLWRWNSQSWKSSWFIFSFCSRLPKIMAPSPLTSKGNGTLARKWRNLKKRCASFGSVDAVGKNGSPGREDYVMGKNGSYTVNNVSAVSEPPDTPLQSIREKLSRWNSELSRRRRRNSHGDSLSQWWNWNGAISASTTPRSEKKDKKSMVVVTRSSSLKNELDHCHRQSNLFEYKSKRRSDEEDDDDEVFVQANPIRKSLANSKVKNAMIVPSSSTAVAAKESRKNNCQNAQIRDQVSRVFLKCKFRISIRNSQDSGYDGYCPGNGSVSGSPASSNPRLVTKSPTASSEDASMSSASNDEGHYGNAITLNLR